MGMILFFALIVTSAGCGTAAFWARSSVRAVVTQRVSLVATVSAILLLVFVIVPRMEELFIDFGTELPAPTLVLLKMTKQLMIWRIAFLMNLCTAFMGGALLFSQYHPLPQHRNTVRWCWLAWMGGLTVLLGAAGTALFLPMVGMLRDLS